MNDTRLPLDLSVIVVSWNTRQLLADCLRSVYDSANDLALEILVVDNASRDGSAEMVRDMFPSVHLVQNGANVGFARANNQALMLAAGRHVMLLNSDTVVLSGALQTLVEFMDAHADAGACGPRLLNADGTLQPSCHPDLTAWREFWRLTFLDRLWHRASYSMERWPVDTPCRVEVIKGACLVLRRSALDAVGLLDERYFVYTEEMDLCHRLAHAGWALYWVPEAQIIHYGGSSTSQVADEMYLQLYRSKAQYQRKFWGERGARRYELAIRLAYAPRWLIAQLPGLGSATWRRRARLYGRVLSEHYGELE